MKLDEKKERRKTRWFYFEIILFIVIYLICGFSNEVGWWWGVPMSFFLWIVINIPIALSNPFSDPFEP